MNPGDENLTPGTPEPAPAPQRPPVIAPSSQVPRRTAAAPVPQPAPASPQPAAGPSTPTAADGRSPFIPLLVVFVSLVSWGAFQWHQLRLEREALTRAHGAQEGPLAQAQRSRTLIDNLMNDTRKLAEGGNPSAKAVVDDLRRRGITLQAPPSATAASAATGASAPAR